MLNNNKQNIEDFFYNQLNDYEASPPSMVWKNLEKELAQQSVWQKFVNISNIKKIFIAASIITVASLAIYYANNTENTIIAENNKDFSSNFNQIDKIEKYIAENINKTIIISPKSETKIVSNKNIVNTIPKKEDAIITNNKEVEKINVKNTENIVVTEITKPKTTIDSISNYKENKTKEVNVIKSKRKYYLNTVNLGEIKNVIFKNRANIEVLKYTPSEKENIIPIDVSTLPEGEYNIIIENEKGIKPYKKVTIK